MPKFDIYRDAAGQFRWRLIARNGEIIAIGEAYTTRAHAIRSARRLKEVTKIALIPMI